MGSLTGPLVMFLVLVIGLAVIMFWNKMRVRGKIACFFLRGDTYMKGSLCEYHQDFVMYEERAYDLYPQRCRFTRFPSGWPSLLQEIVPCALYDYDNAIPLDWTNPPVQLDAKLRAMNVKSALMENMLRKMVEEASREAGAVGGFRFNWRKALPIILIVGGIIGFILITRAGGLGGLFG